MRIPYHKLLKCAIIVALAALQACNSGDSNRNPENTMLLNSIVATRSSSENYSTEYEKPEGTPCFIFCTRDSYVKGDLSPYCVSLPSQNVDAYRENKYITGHRYPENNDDVFATGFSPSSLLPETTEGENAFRKLTIPEELMGKYDILIASQMENGSAIFPFAEPLEFKHAQVKLWLYARLDETMQKFIKNIHVSIGADQMLYKLQWDDSDTDHLKHGYKATDEILQKEDVQMITGPGESSYQLSKEEARYIGYLYMIPGRESVTLTITADMANEADGFDKGEFEQITIVTTVPFADKNNLNITLASNDSYEIEMMFNTDNVELIGRKKAWEDGGYITIPINPFEQLNLMEK